MTRYLEFKSVEGSYVMGKSGKISKVNHIWVTLHSPVMSWRTYFQYTFTGDQCLRDWVTTWLFYLKVYRITSVPYLLFSGFKLFFWLPCWTNIKYKDFACFYENKNTYEFWNLYRKSHHNFFPADRLWHWSVFSSDHLSLDSGKICLNTYMSQFFVVTACAG